MLATLRNRDFSLLWLGGLISLAGDWTLQIGLPIALYQLTRSVAVLSVSLLASLIPSVVVGSLAGVLIDRWDRRRTLIISNLLLALLLAPLLLLRSANLVWLVYVTLFVEACLEQFTRPSESALLPALVAEERLVSANGLISVASNVARLTGPALGGVIAVAFGLSGVTLVDAASFVVAALLFSLIRSPRRQPASQPASSTAEPQPAAPFSLAGAIGHAAREWREGMGVIFHSRPLAVIFLVFSVTSIGEGIMGTLFVVFMTVNAHGDARAYGGTMSAQAVGGLLGGALVALIGARLMSRWSLFITATLFGVIDLAIFNAPTYFPALAPTVAANAPWASSLTLIELLLALFVVVGVPGVALLSGLQSIIQLAAPERYLGRVFGALGACSALFLALGVSLAGWLGPRLGTITLLNAQGAGYIAMGLLLLALVTRPSAAPRPSPDARPANPAEPLALTTE
ncbi:MAG TPA: MFS transporter [Ktedonobacterales bacterium]|jgi:MFS family permease|nr:MFS transporter [Ktedonobacterales bacterium]